MRFVRVLVEGEGRWARWVSEGVARLWTAAPYAGGQEIDGTVAFDSLLAPVTPSKIVCVGRNYAAHAKELGNEVPSEPLLFFKPPSALLAHEGSIVLPAQSQRVEHEGELAVVVGERLCRVDAERALAGVFAITAANDVTARDLQKKDVQFTRGKGFDTFCPIGPWLEAEFGDLAAIDVETRVDGVVRQHGSSAAMIFSVPILLAYISQIMTLEPGDVVLTGTPEGVGPLADGSVVEVSISGVGVLSNRVTRRPE